MISSGRFRPSFQITIADIFQDYNDPRKEMLSHRVQLALQEQERRLKSELDDNNLANLQIMLKKQQVVKHLEEKVEDKQQQIEQLKAKLHYSTGKILDLQSDLSRYTELARLSDEKLKALSGSLKQLESIVQTKETVQHNLQTEKLSLLGANEKLGQQKLKYEYLINNLRQNYSRKMQESEHMLKIHQSRLKEEFAENIQSIKKQNALRQEKKELNASRSVPKLQTKNQRIQCSLQRQAGWARIEAFAQTEQTEQTGKQTIQEFIDNSKPISQHVDNKLDEVRLIYSKSSMLNQESLFDPKVTMYVNLVRQSKETQTQISNRPLSPIKKQPTPRRIEKLPQKNAYGVQAGFVGETEVLGPELQKQKAKRQMLEEEYQRLALKYANVCKEKAQADQLIRQLKLKILECEFDLDRKEHAMSMERQMLTIANQQLQMNQNQLIFRKLSGKTDMIQRRVKPTANCTFFYSKKHHSSLTQNQKMEGDQMPESELDNDRETVHMLAPKKWDSEDAITVIKKANQIRFIQPKRHPITEEHLFQGISDSRTLFKCHYRKYSKSKK